MKLDLSLKFTGSVQAVNAYNPLINYKWNTVGTGGVRYLKDSGKSHSNAQLFFGRGASFNGVDQGSVFELPHNLGSELIINGGFDTDSDWIKGDGWSISDGKAINDGIERNPLLQEGALPLSGVCILTFDLLSAEPVQVYTFNPSFSRKGTFSTTGSQSIILDGGDDRLYFYPETKGDSPEIDNISVKELTQDELYLYKYNYDTNLTEYEHITSPIPYYNLGKLNGTGAFIDNTLSNVITSKVPFSSTELGYLENYPEKFLYREDGILKSKILTQSEIDNIVAYLPMCETDEYIRDLVGYSEVVDNFHLEARPQDPNTVEVISNSTVRLISTEATNDRVDGRVRVISEDASTCGNLVMVEVSIELHSGSYVLSQLEGGTDCKFHVNNITDLVGVVDSMVSGSWVMQWRNADVGSYIHLIQTVNNTYDVTITVNIKKLTSTYPIANYTDACRDDAKQLSTGLQTCFWKRDLLGVPTAGSFDALVSSDIADHTTTNGFNITDGMQMEIVFEQGNQRLSYNRLMEAVDTNASSVFRIERRGVSNKLGFVCNSQSITTGCGGTDICHMIIAFNTASDTIDIYNNGTQITTDKVVDDGINLNTLRLSLMNKNSANRGITGSLRLFKIHTTPQDPLALYESAVKKGLLL